MAPGLQEAGIVSYLHVAELWEARAMAQGMSHRDIPLAMLGEFGPVGGKRRVVLHQTSFDEAVHDCRGHALGVREHEEQGILLNRASRGLIGDTGNRIDDKRTPMDYRDLQAYFTVQGNGFPKS
jgi:hypothetical protein